MQQTPNYKFNMPEQNDVVNINDINENFEIIDSELKKISDKARFIQVAGGTGTAITLDNIDLVNGFTITFVVAKNNNGASTTINGKPLYKPGGTTAPKLIAGRAATVWYNGANFFIKASAEGDAIADNVLAGKIFSNDDDAGIVGTMPNNGSKIFTPNDSIQTSGPGYYSGITVNPRPSLSGTAVSGNVLSGKTFYGSNYTKQTGTMPNNGSKTFTPNDTTQTSGAGYYSGITVNPRPSLSGNAVATDVLSGKTFYGNNYTKQSGSMVNNGAVSHALPINGSYIIPAGYHNGSGKVTQSIPTKAAATYTPKTTDQTIASGQYLSGTQTIKGDANLVASNIRSGTSIFGVTGNLVPGRRYVSGTTWTKTFGAYIPYMRGSDGQQFVATNTWIINVSGLPFTPSIVRITYTSDHINNKCFTFLFNGFPVYPAWYYLEPDGNDRRGINYLLVPHPNANGLSSITNNSFKVATNLGAVEIPFSVAWEAWE